MSYDCVCDYDPAEFYRKEIRRARKPRKCYECSSVIAVGESYEYARGRWDGYFDAFATCQRCADITTWVQNNVPCLCWTHGNRIEDCREAVEEAVWRAPDETVGLRFGFLRRVVQRDRARLEQKT